MSTELHGQANGKKEIPAQAAVISSASSSPSTSISSATTGVPSHDLSWFARSSTSTSSHSSTSSTVALDASLRLTRSNPLGRRIISGNRHAAGTTLLTEAAQFATLTPEQLALRCSACWQVLETSGGGSGSSSSSSSSTATPTTKLRCSACHIARYCSSKCQAAHWTRAHQIECACLKHYKSRLSAGSDSTSSAAASSASQTPQQLPHPAHLPTIWLVCQMVLHLLQRPLRESRAPSIDSAVRESPTWKAKEAKRIESDMECDRKLDEWMARWNQLDGHIDALSSKTRQEYFDMSGLVREVTVHLCLSETERVLHSQRFPIDWYILTFARLSCNAFSVTDHEFRPIGLSVFPSAAMVNHSCQPSAIAFFNCVGSAGAAASVEIRTIREIKPNEEISICYIDILRSRQARRELLKEQYYFDCGCTKCEAAATPPVAALDSIDSTQRSALHKSEWFHDRQVTAWKCQNDLKSHPKNRDETTSAGGVSESLACPGILLSFPPDDSGSSDSDLTLSPSLICSHCNQRQSAAFLLAYYNSNVKSSFDAICGLIQSTATNATSSMLSKQEKLSIHKLKSHIATLHRLYNPLAVCHANHVLLLTAIDQQEWKVAYEALNVSLPLYDFYYASSPNHPLLGLNLLMCAKIGWLLEDSAAALKCYQRALAILRITHGEGHPLVKEAAQSCMEAQMEVQQKSAIAGTQLKAK